MYTNVLVTWGTQQMKVTSGFANQSPRNLCLPNKHPTGSLGCSRGGGSVHGRISKFNIAMV